MDTTEGVANSYTATVYGSPWVEGTGLNNYNVTTITADFVVRPRPLTITANSQSTTYGTALNLGTSAVTASGLVNGDTITSVTLKYNNASSVPGTVNAGAYTGAIAASAVIGTSEALEDTIKREIAEELHLHIAVREFLIQVNHQYPDFNLKMDTFVCEIVGGELALTEHIDYKWLGKEELSALDWAAADVPIVEKLLVNE